MKSKNLSMLIAPDTTSGTISKEQQRERKRIQRSIRILPNQDLELLLMRLALTQDEQGTPSEVWRLHIVEQTVSRRIPKMRSAELKRLQMRLEALIDSGDATVHTASQLVRVKRHRIHRLAGHPQTRFVQGGSPGLRKKAS